MISLRTRADKDNAVLTAEVADLQATVENASKLQVCLVEENLRMSLIGCLRAEFTVCSYASYLCNIIYRL